MTSENIFLKYLGQAGFLVIGKCGNRIVIDPYLSDYVERVAGFKRMQPPVAAPEELKPDIVLATHSHPDHLDVDAYPAFISQKNTFFIGSPDCEQIYKTLDLDRSRYKILHEGKSTKIDKLIIRAVYANHGNLAPEAVGFLINIDGTLIYNVGDSGLATDEILKSLGNIEVDVMIVPINGAFGNLNAAEACALGAVVNPKILVGCHFWMFVEHGGNPNEFLIESERMGLNGVIMAPGESLTISRRGMRLG